MDGFSLINKIGFFLIDAFGLGLAVWVLMAKPKAKINRWFFLTTIFILLWITLVYLASITKQENQAIFLSKLAFLPVYMFLVSIYFFISFFPKEEKRFPLIDIAVLVGAAGLFVTTLFTNIHIKGVVFREWGVSPVLGEGTFFVYSVVFIITAIFSITLLKKYFRLSSADKIKTLYFLIGLLIFIITNIVFNVILASKYTDFPYYLIGNYSVIFLLFFTGYAIIKQELFGIRIVLTTLFVGAIGVLLLLDAVVFTREIILQLAKFFILFIFLVLGYSLIRSILREISLREKLQAAYVKLEELDKAKSEFISIASHQLRTPLTAIMGYVSMVLEGTYGRVTPKAKAPLENVFKSSGRLIKLVNDLLSLSRIEAGKMKLDIREISIEEVIEDVIEELKIETDKKKLYLRFKKPKSSLSRIFIDKEKIRDVVLNIIDNAIRYTNSGGIEVRVEPTGTDLDIIISDTGEGMTQEELLKLFESFSRGAAGTKEYTEGAGLGLYIAKRFVELHKGKIWAESEGKGKGSVFHLRLPVSQALFEDVIKKL